MIFLQIIEAMPHTETVQDFVQKLDDFYQAVEDRPWKSQKKSLEATPEGKEHSDRGYDSEKVNGSNEGEQGQFYKL